MEDKVILSQKDAVITHLKEYGSITSNEAIYKYGATRLSGIIHTLRHKDGYKIYTKTLISKNRYGHNSKYAKYILIKEDKKDE